MTSTTITKREKQILQCLAEGMKSNEIAQKLFISLATVHTHRKNINNKLNAKSNFQLAIMAIELNLISLNNWQDNNSFIQLA